MSDLEAIWRVQRWRAKQIAAGLTSDGKERQRAAPGSAPRLRPFMGIDGEGCGRNRHGQQHYMLLRAGPYELFTGKPLRTAQCLEFICSLPSAPYLVGYAFGYDATMILRDLPPDRLARLFADKTAEPGRSRYTYFERWGIEYLPKNYLRVCRLRVSRQLLPDGRRVPKIERIPGSTRTIWDTIGNFQMSFLSAIKAFEIGREHWDRIEQGKAARASVTRITKAVRRYCAAECDLLAQLMERFREVCHDAGIRPRTWNGAGKLAAFLLGHYHTITRHQLVLSTPAGVLKAANDAYYGGRFEVTRTGEVPGPVWEYDIASAYPAAMQSLPCLVHGEWKPAPPLWLKNAPQGALFVAPVHFRHPLRNSLCGLPVRSKRGWLAWPAEGKGTYWSTEIRSAEALGARIEYLSAGWRYVQNCQCHAFDWIGPLFERRRQLGKGTAGYPIKLAMNSLYGKLAQRIGSPRFGNFIWAGLITAHTRAMLNHAIAARPDAVVMLATDALFSLAPLPLPVGENLGQWEAKQHERLFVVQPGLYWGASRAKTRGISIAILEAAAPRFERAWRRWCERIYPADVADFKVLRNGTKKRLLPEVSVDLNLFTGIRLAHARGKPRTAGVWNAAPKAFSFEWGRKRLMHPFDWQTNRCVRTFPYSGGPDWVSVPHLASADAVAAFDATRLRYDDQPDYFQPLPREL